MSSLEQTADGEAILAIRNLNFYYGDFRGLIDVSMDVAKNRVTAFIGPSGCGKSTLLRTFNRMYDLYPGQRAEGEINFHGKNLLDKKQDVNLVRAKIGMVFQKPTPFPMTIYENIAFGVRLYEKLAKSEMDDRVEWALRKAAMWQEAKDKLQQGPDFHGQDRGTHRRTEAGLHHRHRHPQHAAGCAHLGFHRFHVPGRTGRVRQDRQPVRETPEKADRGLHHRPLRLRLGGGGGAAVTIP